jgi:hypothetical protein
MIKKKPLPDNYPFDRDSYADKGLACQASLTSSTGGATKTMRLLYARRADDTAVSATPLYAGADYQRRVSRVKAFFNG